MEEKTLAEKCFAYRVAFDLTQAEMAQQCNVHWLTIHNCEAGKNLRRMTAAKISSVVNALEDK